MARQKVGSALTVLGLLIFSLLAISAPTSGQDNGVGVMQSDDAKNLTYTQNIMRMYGSNEGGAQSSWPMWTHSASSDSSSDDSVGEANSIGDPNNGGGNREFTWEASNPPGEAVPIDKAIPFSGQIRLSIICNFEQDSCSKAVTVALLLDNVRMAERFVEIPDDNNVYSFEFDNHNIDEIPAGGVLGLYISFSKPNGFSDGYTLYLGSGNDGSWMNVPVLPPYVESIPGLSGDEDYKSPYSGARGFDAEGTATTSWFGLIFWCLFSIGIFVGGFALLPPIPYKEISILLTGIGLLGSMFVAPLISGPILTGLAANPDDKDIWTVEEIAKLEERDGTFLGDELTVGYSFTFYAEYDGVYATTNEGEPISGLGFESDSAILGDSETSRRGKEFVQLYFSLFHADLRPGQAVLAEIEIINTTDLNTGQEVIVPLHADPNSVDTQVVVVSVNGIDSIRYAIPYEVCTIVGQDFSWQYYPILVTAVGLLLGGIGFWQVFKSGRVDDDDEDWEEDEDLEDVLDEFEDDDEELDDLEDI